MAHKQYSLHHPN